MSWEKRSWDSPKKRELFEGNEWHSISTQRDDIVIRHDGETFDVPLDLIRELIAAHDADRRKRGNVDMSCKSGCGTTPHRFAPSPDAGPYWRCSECGEVSDADQAKGGE